MLRYVESTGEITVEQAARNVIAGRYGNGDARKQAIQALGLDYNVVQKKVNELLRAGSQPQAVYYTVKAGDSLSAIARRYGTTVAAIQKLNTGLIKNVNVIRVGWRIRVK